MEKWRDTMIELNRTNLPKISSNIQKPQYNIADTKIGIVHFGPGAFHRAHQAAYIDRLLALDPNYAICGVSLHSRKVKAELGPQDFLYTIAKLGIKREFQIIGAIRNILFAPDEADAVIAQLANPDTKIVTSTITEKGYYLGTNSKIDFTQSEIAFDLKNLHAPKSFYGFILAGLIARKQANLAPFTIIPCDNLSMNGINIKNALSDFTRQAAPEYLDYVSSVKCPCTMVDSITPATSDKLREYVSQTTNFKDNWPIEREEFLQWVIEDYEGSGAIPWRQIGVEITNNIAQYENSKLRILNGAHSSLAYFGLLKGHKTVYEAMQDSEISEYVKSLIFDEIIPNISADFDLVEYANSVISRFENPAIAHQLSQIAWDGSKKLPVRILPTIMDARTNGRQIENLCFSLSCWIAFVCRQVKNNIEIIDPLTNEFANVCKNFNGTQDDIGAFLDNIPIFNEDFKSDKIIVKTIKDSYKSINSKWEVTL